MDVLGRTLMTISCADADLIPKAPGAGRIVDTPDGPVQVMHNGLKVVAGGYHGDWMAHVIRALHGHHEPQEELIFDRLLRYVRHHSLIVELGAFWAYYSLWYLNEIPGSRAVCIEPDPANKAIGTKNARLNELDDRIAFHSAWIGNSTQEAHTSRIESTGEDLTLPCFDMRKIVSLCEGRFIEVLHMDTQGAELPFLASMQGLALQDVVRFVVVSTHHSSISGSKTTHTDCIATIERLGGTILVEHDVQESFSGDGLIVASFLPHDRRLAMPEISRNTPRNSLFPDL